MKYEIWVYCFNKPAGRTDWFKTGTWDTRLEAERGVADGRRWNPGVHYEIREVAG